ncbi:MAG: flagellar assembly protein FliH [Gammaproteobacteria bacterium]|nr:MAG: flagellar assembly protein FliH [Gammaproteobacteria bacterium]
MATSTSEAAAVRRWQAPDVGASVPAPSAPTLTAEQLETIEAQAREAGYARGLEEGREAGRAEMQAAAQRLAGLLETIDPLSGVLDTALVEQLAELVLAISRQFVRRELAREPGEIVRVVREALAALPVSGAVVHLHLHPEDVLLVREALPAEHLENGLKLHEDLTVTRGGARLETEVSRLDATVETRLAAIATEVFGDERRGGDDGVES